MTTVCEATGVHAGRQHASYVPVRKNKSGSCTLSTWPLHRYIEDEENARDNHVLASNFARYSPILKPFSLTDSALSLS